MSYTDEPKRVALFVSRHDHCLMELLWRFARKELPCAMAMQGVEWADRMVRGRPETVYTVPDGSRPG